ncbi:MAG: hypothetical protein R2769_04085 [Saprospiraceae bacterium]
MRPDSYGLELFIFSAKFSQNFRRADLIPDFYKTIFVNPKNTFGLTLWMNWMKPLQTDCPVPELRDYLELILPEIRHYSERSQRSGNSTWSNHERNHG